MLILIGVATMILPTALFAAHLNLLCVVPFGIGFVVIVTGLGIRPESHWKGPVVAIIVGAWIWPIGATVYLNRSGEPVEFVVPVDYQGTIELIKDQRRGEVPRFQDGKYVFLIPPSGVL